MKKQQLEETPAWIALKEHFEEIRSLHLRDLFKDKNRFQEFSLSDRLLTVPDQSLVRTFIRLSTGAVGHQFINDGGIGEGTGITQIFQFIGGNLAQYPTHDLAGTRLG